MLFLRRSVTVLGILEAAWSTLPRIRVQRLYLLARVLTQPADEPEEEPGEGTTRAQRSQPGKRRTRARGKVHDPRQDSFEM
ncbi:MAG: hypothetical protein JO157_02465 [Acetobacteraceae bacterium]|nr:hypothetical protein [Acetobacteraceae bacterium]